MTFCKILKEETTPSGKTISAYENIEKYETVPSYQIIISVDGIAVDVIPAARTTWARKFKQALNENK